jgi:transcriptional regulator with XRE-family HTH domain
MKKKPKVAKKQKSFKRVIDPAVAQIGTKIRTLREAKGLTIAGLAKKLGTSGSSLGQIENGWRTPSANYLDKIAKALGTTRLALAGLAERDFWSIVRACAAWDKRH